MPSNLRATLPAVILTVVSLCGCAMSFDAADATAHITPQNSHPYSVSVTLHLGPNQWLGAEDRYFPAMQQAVTDSINSSRVFNRVVPVGASDYLLDARVLFMDARGSGDSTSNIRILWSLQQVSSGKVIWAQTFRTSCALTMKDSFVGLDRMYKAAACGIRANASKALTEIGELDL